MKENKVNKKEKEEKITNDKKEVVAKEKAEKEKAKSTEKKATKKDKKNDKEKKKTQPAKKSVNKKEVKREKQSKMGLSKEATVNNEKLKESITKLTGRDFKEIEKKIQDEVKNEINNKTNNKTNKKEKKEEEPEGIIINEPKSKEKSKTVETKLQEQLEEEVKDKYKKRRIRKIIVIVILILLILICVGVFVLGYFKGTIRNDSFYQWTSGQKVQYNGDVTFTRGNQISNLKPNDESIVLDSTPVYFLSEKNKVVLPKEMCVIYPNDNGATYRIKDFSEVTVENEATYITDSKKTKIEDAFLYDGKDLYFFLNTTRITVNGTNYEVSPLSYIVTNNNQNVEIYNYEKDEFQVINTVDAFNVKVTTNSYTIDMTTDSLQTLSKDQTLPKDFKKLQDLDEK